MLRFVYKVFPVYIRYVDEVKNGFAGFCYGPYVIIEKPYRSDRGLLEHELTHSRQFYRTFCTMGLWYTMSSKYRYKCELEAYKVQLSYAGNGQRDRLAGLFAGFIANKYNLDIDRDETKKALLDDYIN